MKVAIITDGIDDGAAGVGSYARGLTSALAQDGAHQIVLVHRRPHEFYASRNHIEFGGGGGKLIRKQLLMRPMLNRAGFDLVHETFHFPPFFGQTQFLKVLTVHDLAPFVLGRRYMNRRHWLTHRLFLPPLVRRADHVITDSEHSKRDIERILGLPSERVTAVHLAAGSSFSPRPDAEIAAVRARYRLPEHFVLFVGTIEPRKNLPRLVQAFERVAGRLHDLALVIAGGLGWEYRPLLRAIEASPVRERILLPGRVAQEDLPALLSGATAFAYPSLYEGFGLPPLEAMQCGCPVVTSNSSSLPEVVGDAALTVDPRSPDELAEALVRISTDRELQSQLRERGLRRSRLFSWEACARETVAVYDALAASRQAALREPSRNVACQVPRDG